jgi:7-cyano-7-deazaguanine reductase
VTGQPDYYVVRVSYNPSKFCVESKTVKLYFQKYRNKGLFCEAFAAKIARDFCEALQTAVMVTVEQKPRGGVAISASATTYPKAK